MRMSSNHDQFEARGDSWSGDVPPWFGLTREPKRYREKFHPDGFLERKPNDELVDWDRGLRPTRAKPRPSYHEKPVEAEVIERGKNARREFNARRRRLKAKIKF